LVLTIENIVQKIFPDFSINTASYAQSIFSWMTDNFTDIVFGTLTIVIDLILFLIATFFFIRDGRYFVDELTSLSPMRDGYDREIISKVSGTINSVIKGTLTVSIIQGVLVGIGLSIFSVPNAVLWGAISAVCAVVPGLGTGLILIPSVIYLLFIGNTPYAIGLIIWGGLLVGTIDNFLSPYIIKSKTKIHSMLILFSVLGGIALFGPEGFIFGPVIVSILVSFVGIYKSSLLEDSKVDFIP
jgi:predicted PurR-regulated permease PerM